MRGNGEGESFHLPAASSWGRCHAMTQEEAESWFNVCVERVRRASITATGEAHCDMVVQKWANYMGKGKWEGAEQPPYITKNALSVLCVRTHRAHRT